MSTQRHLYLDLEDTIIEPVTEGWPNTRLINTQKIRAFIDEFKPHYLHIFSFAIHNEWEKKGFMTFVQRRIEEVCGMPVTVIPMVDSEIIFACCKMMGISTDTVSFSDMCDFWGKQQAFRLCMRNLYRNNSTPVELVLLDDVVYNEEITWLDLNVKLRIFNIDQMP